jgi:CheY-like chemotaxis protein
MRVLFVDDNEDLREMVGALLEAEGLRVVGCASGEQAEREFAAGEFDFVLTDVSLPSMSGIELARRVLQRRPDMWVVFLSGYAMESQLKGWGPRVRWLSKPFEPEALQRLIEEIRTSAR